MFFRVAPVLLLMSTLTSEKTLHVGKDVIDVDRSKQRYSHLELVALSNHSYGDVETILGQDVFHSIRPLEFFESDPKNISNCRPNTAGLNIEWTIAFDLMTRLDFLQNSHAK